MVIVLILHSYTSFCSAEIHVITSEALLLNTWSIWPYDRDNHKFPRHCASGVIFISSQTMIDKKYVYMCIHMYMYTYICICIYVYVYIQFSRTSLYAAQISGLSKAACVVAMYKLSNTSVSVTEIYKCLSQAGAWLSSGSCLIKGSTDVPHIF
jgi:hypothetical protein